MIRATLLFAVAVMLAAPCLAGVGFLGPYGDAEGSLCQINDVGGNTVVSAYVVHKLFFGSQATGSRFAIQAPNSGTWIFVDFESPFTVVGSAQTDISVYYGGCATTSTLVGTARWISVVAVPPCGGYISVRHADALADIIISDCTDTLNSSFGRDLLINPTFSCNCLSATQPSTWGSVKALYR